MPSPSSALSTQRPDLAASMEAFDLEAEKQNYIGTRVAPVISVVHQAGNFGKIPLDQLLQNRDTLRAAVHALTESRPQSILRAHPGDRLVSQLRDVG